MKKACLKCGNEFIGEPKRKYCSRACSDSRERPKHQVRCRECATLFDLKKSQEEKHTAWGSFCSPKCRSAFRARASTGSGNPNFKGRNLDSDGYRLFPKQASLKLGLGPVKLHQAVAMMAVGLKKIPAGMHVHHRDCNVLNNDPRNLQFITISDHVWLHKQFGGATLAAIERGECEVATAASWSDDPLRATGLLMQDVLMQAEMLRYHESKGIRSDIAASCTQRPIRVSFTVVDNFGSSGR